MNEGGARRHLLAMGVLIGLVWGVFAQTAGFSYLNFDDPAIVFNNDHVKAGLTPATAGWAFTHAHFGLYMPITSLTHLLDVRLFGLWPGGHHLSSVFWHTLAVLALYGALVALTGSFRRSLLLAALFAIHPTRVTSVAWIADRKDVVCGFFFFLGVWAWARYAVRRTWFRYALVVICGLLATLSKPTAVTFPCVLLLLDGWPLGRAARGAEESGRAYARKLGGLVFEKLPLFAIAGAASAIAVWTQQSIKGLASLEGYGIERRLGNTALSYGRYVLHTILPVNLSIHYPHFPGPFPWGEAIVSACFCVAVIVCVCVLYRKGWLFVGWFWFLGVFMPMSGLTQFGNASMADRFLYLPQVGLLLLFVWSIPSGHKRVTTAAAAALVALFAGMAFHETRFWRDTETVFTHALETTRDNDLAHSKLGELDFAQGRLSEAAAHYEESCRLYPDEPDYCYDLGAVRMAQGRDAEAAELIARALRGKPDWADALINLGCVYVKLRQFQAALAPFERALALEPGQVNGHINYGVALLNLGRKADAARQFEEALRLEPGNAAAKVNLDLARQP